MKKINILIISLMFLAGIVYLPQLPDVIPMHWNIMGEVDNYMPKNIAVWILPVLNAVMFAAFQIVPSFDPKKENTACLKRNGKLSKP